MSIQLPPSPFSPNIIPDSTQPILAYRHWTVTSSGQLSAPIHNDRGRSSPWRPGECIARCGSGYSSDHEIIKGTTKPFVTMRSCRCGFYGVWGVTHEYAARQTNFEKGYGVVFGVAAYYGRVLIGPSGLRGSKARVVALHIPPYSRFAAGYKTAASLMETYGIAETKFYRKRVNLLQAHLVHRPDEYLALGIGYDSPYG